MDSIDIVRSFIGRTVTDAEIVFSDERAERVVNKDPDGRDEPVTVRLFFNDGSKLCIDANSHDWGGTEHLDVTKETA